MISRMYYNALKFALDFGYTTFLLSKLIKLQVVLYTLKAHKLIQSTLDCN